MATSVPSVIPIEEFQLQAVRLIELGAEATQLTGDLTHLELALKEVRGIYEAIFKSAANMGRMDRQYVTDIGKTLERVEGVVARARVNIASRKS